MKIKDIQVGDLLQWKGGAWFVVTRIEGSFVYECYVSRYVKFWGLSLKLSQVVFLLGNREYVQTLDQNIMHVYRGGQLIE